MDELYKQIFVSEIDYTTLEDKHTLDLVNNWISKYNLDLAANLDLRSGAFDEVIEQLILEMADLQAALDNPEISNKEAVQKEIDKITSRINFINSVEEGGCVWVR